MPRFNRSLSPIHSVKHYVQQSKLGLTSASEQNLEIADAVAINTGNPTDVLEGSTIKAVYVEIWVTADISTETGFVIATVEKLSSGASAPSSTNLLNLNAYQNKKNILKTFQGLTPADITNPIPIFKEWIAIPKGKQRMGAGDKIVFSVYPPAGGAQICGFFLFKEYQ